MMLNLMNSKKINFRTAQKILDRSVKGEGYIIFIFAEWRVV